MSDTDDPLPPRTDAQRLAAAERAREFTWDAACGRLAEVLAGHE